MTGWLFVGECPDAPEASIMKPANQIIFILTGKSGLTRKTIVSGIRTYVFIRKTIYTRINAGYSISKTIVTCIKTTNLMQVTVITEAKSINLVSTTIIT